MCSLRPFVAKLFKSLPRPPAGQDALKELVTSTLVEAKLHASSDNGKSEWEYLLKDEILKLATNEGKALKANREAYYQELRDKLDVVLLFTEQGACDQIFPHSVYQDLFESQTIETCSQIFSWVEDRGARLTVGLVPQKGKALVLLRALNDLLRRLSKVGSTTIFCGRILTFLSAVFPLGERSGVNLRGGYGPTWEGVSVDSTNVETVEEEKPLEEKDGEDVVMTSTASGGSSGSADKDKMDVDGKEQSEAERKAEFYNTFWSLQLFFSKPTTFAQPGSLEEFKQGVSKVMPVIKEATAKERAMMGSRNLTGTAASLKRKREPENEETNVNEYFFAKFLTSPDLLDLEIADTHFRRQFLLQLLILLQHLLHFTPEKKAQWMTGKNRSLQMDFTLEPSEAQWAQESTVKVFEELKQTTPNGRQFAETVSTILDREKNWVNWKDELCNQFDKDPWEEEVDGKMVGLWDATKEARTKMRKFPEPYEWALGSASLTEVWELGFRRLDDLERYSRPLEWRDFVKKLELADRRIQMRQTQLAAQAERIAKANAKRVAAQQQQVAAEKADVVSEAAPAPAPAPATQTAPSTPKPVPATGSAPLHPSLPPKPGTPIKTNQEPAKPAPSGTGTPTIVVEAPPAAVVAAPSSAPTEEKKEEPEKPKVVVKPRVTDEQILKLEDEKLRLNWLGLRIARDQYLALLGHIGPGNLDMLAGAIDADKKKAAEDAAKAAAKAASAKSVGTIASVESNEDVKMDGGEDIVE